MHTIRLNDDIIVEVNDGEPPVIRIRCLSLEVDGDCPGVVILFREELSGLVKALGAAHIVAAEMEAGTWQSPVIVGGER
ncbi:MAG: hypothetical protein JW918_00955 [Anaerolineae bacterium]|nr:hypothetical protein [Anaerolineae bacterium]